VIDAQRINQVSADARKKQKLQDNARYTFKEWTRFSDSATVQRNQNLL
jgi:hypothetical protein